uniref:Ig-like domain-containing protein n=1 Tax=Neolamprologus brichardi TaxID=32507 RepID=A0A3Q4HS34_NEOBR
TLLSLALFLCLSLPFLCYCQLILPKPRISMNPANKVKWRSDVSITCSISPQSQQLLQGEFTLRHISGSFSQTKLSTTNSATFKILKVDFDMDGLYQCEYSHDSSISTSDSVNLSVTGNKILYITCTSCCFAPVLPRDDYLCQLSSLCAPTSLVIFLCIYVCVSLSFVSRPLS